MRGLERRIIYLLIALSVIIPFLFKIKTKVEISPPVMSAYNTIESLKEGTPVLISIDYDPASMPELQPMLLAILRHCVKKKLKIILMAHWPLGVPLGQEAIEKIAKEYGLKYGEDYVNLGYRPGGAGVIISMGREIRDIFDCDFKGTPVDSLPLMRNVHNYDDIGVVIGLEAGSVGDWWAQNLGPRFGAKLILGSTAVVTPDLYPYLASGQCQGLIGGLRGAAEYENLVGHPSVATIGMIPQSAAHALIIIFIIIGNIIYILQRRRK